MPGARHSAHSVRVLPEGSVFVLSDQITLSSQSAAETVVVLASSPISAEDF